MVKILGGKLHEYIKELNKRADTYSEEGKYGEANELWRVVAELKELMK